MNGMEMPKYRCHKLVWALLIAAIVRDGEGEDRETDGSAMITPADTRYAPFKVDAAYMRKHKPEVGGYYVVYADGYKSFSPADAFEGGYTLITNEPAATVQGGPMDFGAAVRVLKAGKKVARSGWNGKGMWLEQQTPDAHSKMTLPYLFLNYPDNAQNTPGARVPWLASQTDVLAEDWHIIT